MKPIRKNEYDTSGRYILLKTNDQHPLISDLGEFLYKRSSTFINHVYNVVEIYTIKYSKDYSGFYEISPLVSIHRVLQIC